MTNFDRPVEIFEIPEQGPWVARCPLCNRTTTAAGRFCIAAVGAGGRRPVCGRCVAKQAPALARALRDLNRLAESLLQVEPLFASPCADALNVLSSDAKAAAPTGEDPGAAARTSAGRAMLAVIARQCYRLTDISVADTIGDADPLLVIASLARLIASKIEESTTDVAGMLAWTFVHLAADEDEG
ncbi:hypothetical protein ABIA35_006011 [Catenulispora sp. MAP12-49]|uniref:hypothetical protein n=1 Tax=Catenulispora sp. MAP12-49 TaxID=3156302 RepID=UPI0035116A44